MTKDQEERYSRAAHRVQTAIAFLMQYGDRRCEPKHLRVGVDLSKADMHGLVTLLIAKGLISMEEYIEAMVSSTEEEADQYEKQVQEHLGQNVRLR